jgi:hypothetical protein
MSVYICSANLIKNMLCKFTFLKKNISGNEKIIFKTGNRLSSEFI